MEADYHEKHIFTYMYNIIEVRNVLKIRVPIPDCCYYSLLIFLLRTNECVNHSKIYSQNRINDVRII